MCAGEREQTAGVPPPPSSPAGQARRGEVGRGAEHRAAAGEGEARGRLCGALPESSRQSRPRRTAGAGAAAAAAVAAVAAAAGGGGGGAPRRSLRLTPPLGH